MRPYKLLSLLLQYPTPELLGALEELEGAASAIEDASAREPILRFLAGWEFTAAVWDRDILQFFLTGMMLFGLGLIGEYVGRIYQQVRERPRYLIQAILEQGEA